MAAILISGEKRQGNRQAAKPRLGFLGVGWIGRNRLEAIAKTELAEIVALADPVADMAHKASEHAPDAAVLGTLEEVLDSGVDGVVIATPSALHAEESITALKAGVAVFCQKPLGRDAVE